MSVRRVRNPDKGELVLAAAIVLITEAYMWLVAASAPWTVAIPIALTLVLWFRQKQTLDSLGLGFANFVLSFRRWAVLWILIAVLFLFAGRHILFHFKILTRGVIYFIWCALQQLLYQSIVCAVLRKSVTPRWAAALVSGVIFALLHTPNPVLVPGTFVWGVASFFLFEICPSVYGLALLQVMLSSTLMWWTPIQMHHGFRVGPAYRGMSYRPRQLTRQQVGEEVRNGGASADRRCQLSPGDSTHAPGPSFRELHGKLRILMNRRDVLLSLAAVAAPGSDTVAAAKQPSHDSLYIPKAHLVEDRKLLHDFMEDYAFVDLVTAAPGIRVTHIPVLLDRTSGPYGTVYGHIARNNPQSETFDGRQQAVIVYRGPNSYISPSWYANTPAVPTWNFAVVHASGTLKPITDKKALHDLLAKLIKTNENRYTPSSTYDFSKIPDTYIGGMIGGIIGFEMQIDQLEGKFKLGQERTEADKTGILRNLQTAKQDPTLRDLTASYYERLNK